MGKIDMILDGGDTGLGLKSVLDLSTEVPTILRPGGNTRRLKGHHPQCNQDSSITNKQDTPKSQDRK